MNDTFMKDKPVFPLIISMALPMVISMLVNSLYNIVDSFFVAQISETAMFFQFRTLPMRLQLDLESESVPRLQSVSGPETTRLQVKPPHTDLYCQPCMVCF